MEKTTRRQARADRTLIASEPFQAQSLKQQKLNTSIESANTAPELLRVRSNTTLSIKSVEPLLILAMVGFVWLFLHYNQMAAAGIIAAALAIPIMQRILQSGGK